MKRLGCLFGLLPIACSGSSSIFVEIEIIEPVSTVSVKAETGGSAFIDCTLSSDGSQNGLCPFEESRTSWDGSSPPAFVLYGEPGAAVHVEVAGHLDEGVVISRDSRDESLPSDSGGQKTLTLRLAARSEVQSRCALRVGTLPVQAGLGALTAIWRDEAAPKELVANVGGAISLISHRAGSPECTLKVDAMPRGSTCPARPGDFASGQLDGVEQSNEVAALCRTPMPLVRIFGYTEDASATTPQEIDRFRIPAEPNRISHPVIVDTDGDGRDEVAILYSPPESDARLRSLRLRIHRIGEPDIDELVIDAGLVDTVVDIDIGPIVVEAGNAGAEILLIAGYGKGIYRYLHGRGVHAVRENSSLLPYKIGAGISVTRQERQVLAHVLGTTLSMVSADLGDADTWEYPLDRTINIDDARHLRIASADIEGFGPAAVLASSQQIQLFEVAPTKKTQSYSIEGGASDTAALTLLTDLGGEPGAEIFVFDVAAQRIIGVDGTGEALPGWPIAPTVAAPLGGAMFLDLDNDRTQELTLLLGDWIEVFSFGPESGASDSLSWTSPFRDLRQTSALSAPL